jgi:hypothetical protein
VVLAIGDALVEVRVGLGVVPVAVVQFVQVRVCEAGFILDSVLERDRQRAAQHGLPVATREPHGLRLRRRRPALHCRHAESDREFLSAPGERDHDIQTPGSILKRGEAAVCRCEFRRGPERLQDRDGGLGCGEDLVAAAQPPQHRGHPLERVAFAAGVAGRPPVLQSSRVGGLGIRPVIDHRQLRSELDPAGRDAGRRLAVRETQRTFELPGSFAMGCQRASATTGRRSMFQGRRAVVGLVGVKGQPGIIVTAESAQPLQYPSMEFGTPGRQDRLLDRLTRDLVPEAHNRMAGYQSRRDDLG